MIMFSRSYMDGNSQEQKEPASSQRIEFLNGYLPYLFLFW